MGTLITFPKRYKKTLENGFRINLYTEQEVEMTLFCINIWGNTDKIKYCRDDLRTLEPVFVKEALKRAHGSNLLSYEARAIINNIMKSIEPIHASNSREVLPK